jgi:peptide/nickel transport system substrate-binding protein
MPLARRGALTALLALGSALLALGWLFAGQVQPASDAVYREATFGQALRVNPLAVPANQAEADLTALVFAGLMRLGPDGMPEPGLAERWEVTPDGLTYTFHLRANATWHDGAVVDADDVAFTIERIQAEDFAGSEALSAQWADVQLFVADSRTLLVRLPEPAADFLVRATLGILPRHLADQMEAGTGFAVPPFDREPVGAGPYRLVDLREDRALLRHNSSYVLGSPPIRRLELHFAANGAEALRWLADGRVDGALLDEVAPRDGIAAALEARSSLVEHPVESGRLTVLYFNNQRAPLDDAATRRALAASVDAAAAVATSGVSERPATGLIHPLSWAYPAPIEAEETAADLWAAAGWERVAGRLERGDQPLTLELVTNGEPDRVALAQAIATQLTEAGVAVELVTAPAQRVVSDYLRPGLYDLTLFGWDPRRRPGPLPRLAHLAGSGAAATSPASRTHPRTRCWRSARTTLDIGRAADLYALFAERFEELGGSVVISYPTYTYVLRPQALQGIEDRLLVRPRNSASVTSTTGGRPHQ